MKPASTPLQQPQVGSGLRPGELLALEPGEAGIGQSEGVAEVAREASVVELRSGNRRHRLQPWQLARACALLAGGVALVPTPAPGILLILWGLKGLGRGFHWARRIEVPIRRRLRRTRVGRLATGVG